MQLSASFEHPTDEQYRNWIERLAIGAAALNLLAGVRFGLEGDLFQLLLGSATTLVMLYIWWLNRRGNTQADHIHLLAIIALAFRLLGDMLQTLWQRLPPGILLSLELLILALLMLNLLPLPLAVRGLAGFFALFVIVALASGQFDLLAISMMGITLLVIYFSTVYSRLIIEERWQNWLLRDQLSTDALTGAASRRSIEERFRAVMSQPAPSGMLLMVDIDHFKQLNDRFGHAAGDQVLRHVAQRLIHGVQDPDLVGRWGGEEFMILMLDIPGHVRQQSIERLLHLARQPRPATSNLPGVTVSIGAATFSEGQTPEEVLQRADERLYRAKALGRNCFVME
ncbi:GGDEF domain-containing protein [Deinococcus piscis]|uniref:GGDEF domain-containing protein n=1 Tax=Deinococcus piscis TaxID=394230 RepID=A0ABQ3K669_9DEIO|nr:GGDEF domain-containing protein [Deinococcus piscis]GHG05433.1 GGDEF domain-containing protein [Deinococcus piscis]